MVEVVLVSSPFVGEVAPASFPFVVVAAPVSSPFVGAVVLALLVVEVVPVSSPFEGEVVPVSSPFVDGRELPFFPFDVVVPLVVFHLFAELAVKAFLFAYPVVDELADHFFFQFHEFYYYFQVQ